MWLEYIGLLVLALLVAALSLGFCDMVCRWKERSVKPNKIKLSKQSIKTLKQHKILLIVLIPLLVSGCCVRNTPPAVLNGIVIHPTPADVNNMSDHLSAQILTNNEILSSK